MGFVNPPAYNPPPSCYACYCCKLFCVTKQNFFLALASQPIARPMLTKNKD